MCAENTGNDALEAVRRELYQLRPWEFTETRDRRAAESRAQGHGTLAESISALRRPSNAAWAVNMLATAERRHLDSLIDIGDSLRSAQRQSLGQRLRELSRRRSELLEQLTESALVLASRSGYSLSDQARQQIESTLNAAVSDSASARAVRAGTLVKPLAYSGFGQEPPEPSSTPSEAEVPDVPPAEPARRDRQPDLEAARHALEQAAEELHQADERLHHFEERKRRIEAQRRELQNELDDLVTELQETDTALIDTRHRRAEAQRQRSSLRQRVRRLERKQNRS